MELGKTALKFIRKENVQEQSKKKLIKNNGTDNLPYNWHKQGYKATIIKTMILSQEETNGEISEEKELRTDPKCV